MWWFRLLEERYTIKIAPKIAVPGFLLLCLMLAGCGYHIEGYTVLPGKVRTVHVGLIENRSDRTGAEYLFTNALISEIMERTAADIVPLDRADARITGVIRSITVGALTRSSDDDVLQGRVSASVDLALSAVDGHRLWSVRGMHHSEIYTASTANITDEAAKSEAVDRIAQRLAEKLVSSMTDQW